MERLTIPDEPIEGGLRRAVIDIRAVKEQAMTIYWRLKAYEDTGLSPEEITDGKLLTGWIPVTERVPEDGGVVHVTVRHGNVDVGYYDVNRKEWWSTDDEWLLDVIAWLPEPEPFVPLNGDFLRKDDESWE
nr:MAG TPA: Protein of unknown function (DUF551) [Caudoviricetes sp.]